MYGRVRSRVSVRIRVRVRVQGVGLRCKVFPRGVWELLLHVALGLPVLPRHVCELCLGRDGVDLQLGERSLGRSHWG